MGTSRFPNLPTRYPFTLCTKMNIIELLMEVNLEVNLPRCNHTKACPICQQNESTKTFFSNYLEKPKNFRIFVNFLETRFRFQTGGSLSGTTHILPQLGSGQQNCTPASLV